MDNTTAGNREEWKKKIEAEFTEFGLVKSHNEVEGDLLAFQDKLKNSIKNRSVNRQAIKNSFYDLQEKYNILQKVFKEKYLLYQDLQKIKSTETAMMELVNLFNLFTQNNNQNRIQATNFYTAIPTPPKKERRFSFPGLTNITSKVKKTFRRGSFGGKRKNKTRKH